MSDKVVWGAFPEGPNGTGEPPMPPSLEHRVASLERGVDALNIKMDSFSEHYATKADIHQVESRIIKWLVGTTMATAGLAFAIARFLAGAT